MLFQTWIGAHGALLAAMAFLSLLGCSSRVTDQRDGAGGSTSTGGQGGAGSVTAGSGGPGSGNCQPGAPPVALASGEDSPFALAIDADFVYFTTSLADMCSLGGAVKRVSKQGGAPEILGKAVRPLSALAVDDKTVYWTDDIVSPCTDPADPGYTIIAAPKGGGAQMMFPFSAQFQTAEDIALDETAVYWVSADMSSVRRAAKTGGKPAVLFTGGDAPIAVAVDNVNVYWAGAAGIVRAPKAGGASSKLAPPPFLGGFGGIGAAAGSVYFGAFVDCQGADCTLMGSIKRVSIDGGAVVDVASTTDKQPVRIALDEQDVYWTSKDAVPPGQLPLGTVMRASRAGGPAEQIFGGQTPHGIAVDDTCVYWTDTGDGTVMKAPK